MIDTRRALAVLAAILGLAAVAADLGAPARAAARFDPTRDVISALDLAERIVRGAGSLRLIDLRSAPDFAELHIPTAVSVSSAGLDTLPLPPDATVVIYGDEERQSREAWVRVRARGPRQVLIVREGLYEWITRVLEPRLATDATAAERAAFERAAALSRFFGGQPRANVDRREVPTDASSTGGGAAPPGDALRQAVAAVRRRGC